MPAGFGTQARRRLQNRQAQQRFRDRVRQSQARHTTQIDSTYVSPSTGIFIDGLLWDAGHARQACQGLCPEHITDDLLGAMLPAMCDSMTTEVFEDAERLTPTPHVPTPQPIGWNNLGPTMSQPVTLTPPPDQTQGAGGDIEHCYGSNSLHLATSQGHVKVVQALLGLGSDVNAQDDHKRTALHYAAILGHEDVVRCLLLSGAVVDSTDCDGLTPLHHAAQNGHESILRNLVCHGADVHVRVCKTRRDGRLVTP